jgi:modification methylase
MEVDHIYNKSCERMTDLHDNSINMIVSSPPYYNCRDYAQWDIYEHYTGFIWLVLGECFRVMKPGAWICWNIQDCIPFPPEKGRHERFCEPITADTISLMRDVGFLYEKDIIWYKGKGTATQKLFGSYPSPSLILVSGLTEHIITARKPRPKNFKREIDEVIKKKSELTKKEWGEWAVDLWDIPPVNSKKTKHPAPYPVELAYRLVRLNSFYGDIVLDPFMGSGSTAIAAKRCGRHYIGYEKDKEYITEAKYRISQETGLGFEF